jgi:hypothetical protein
MPLGKGALTGFGLVLAASGLWVLQVSTGRFVISLYYLAPLVIAGHLIMLGWTLWKFATHPAK